MKNKELMNTKVMPYFIVLGICLVGILFGSFFDWSLSSALVDTKNPFGGFIETLGFLPSFLMIVLSGCMLFKGIYPSDKKWMKILGYAILLATYLLSGYLCANYITDQRSQDKLYGIVFSPLLSYVIGYLFCLVFLVIFLYIVKSKDYKFLILAGSIILLCMASQYLFVGLIKKLNCRPRYRYLTDDNLNMTGEVFRSWWEFKTFAFQDDYHKSFPSGHSANSCVTLLLPLLANVLRKPFKHSQTILFFISAAYTFLVAFFRIEYGAHFLSDVCFGILFTTLFILFYLFLGEKIFHKKEVLSH